MHSVRGGRDRFRRRDPVTAPSCSLMSICFPRRALVVLPQNLACYLPHAHVSGRAMMWLMFRVADMLAALGVAVVCVLVIIGEHAHMQPAPERGE